MVHTPLLQNQLVFYLFITLDKPSKMLEITTKKPCLDFFPASH